MPLQLKENEKMIYVCFRALLSIDGLNGKKEVIHPSALRKFGRLNNVLSSLEQQTIAAYLDSDLPIFKLIIGKDIFIFSPLAFYSSVVHKFTIIIISVQRCNVVAQFKHFCHGGQQATKVRANC